MAPVKANVESYVVVPCVRRIRADTRRKAR